MTDKQTLGPDEIFKRPDGKIDIPSPDEKSAKEFVQKYEFANEIFQKRRELLKQSIDGTPAPESEFHKRLELLRQSQSQPERKGEEKGEEKGEGGKSIEKPELAPGAGVYVGARKTNTHRY